VPVSKHAIQKGEEGGAQPKEQVQPAKSKKPQTLVFDASALATLTLTA
jgi:hypothetical protein